MYMCMVTNWSLDGRFAINNSRRLILRESVHLTTVPPEQYINLSNVVANILGCCVQRKSHSCPWGGGWEQSRICYLSKSHITNLPLVSSPGSGGRALFGPEEVKHSWPLLIKTTEVKLLDFGYCKVESSSGFFYDCPQPWNLDLKTGALLGKSWES